MNAAFRFALLLASLLGLLAGGMIGVALVAVMVTVGVR